MVLLLRSKNRFCYIPENNSKHPVLVWNKSPEEAPLIILDRSSAVFIFDDSADTNHTSNISGRVHFVSNGDRCKMHKVDWYEGGIQLVDIVTKNFGENDLNTRMKYIMVSLENW